MPYRMLAPERERCCWCGADTRSGIYLAVVPAPEHCTDRLLK